MADLPDIPVTAEWTVGVAGPAVLNLGSPFMPIWYRVAESTPSAAFGFLLRSGDTVPVTVPSGKNLYVKSTGDGGSGPAIAVAIDGQ